MSHSTGVAIGPVSEYALDTADRFLDDYGLILFTIVGPPACSATALIQQTRQSWTREAPTEDEAVRQLAEVIDAIFTQTPPLPE